MEEMHLVELVLPSLRPGPPRTFLELGGADGLYGVTRDGTFAFLARVAKGVYNSAPAVCATNDVVVFGAMVLGEAVTPVELLGYALSLTAFGAYNYFRLYDI